VIFGGEQRPSLLAVAAVLTLIAGAVLIGIFGRQIDDQRSLPPVSQVAAAAVFADSEHRHFAGRPEEREQQMIAKDPLEAAREASGWLGVDVKIPDLIVADYEFCAAGPCELPGTERSFHLMYRKVVEPNQPAPMVSIYVARDRGQFNCKSGCLSRGEWMSCLEDLDCQSKCKLEVFRTSDGNLVYFLVCCSSADLQAIRMVASGELREK
jgi:hypothetical protein